ncbi:N-acetylmuramoyl-L-alanine amidase [Kushneria phyllosphaerae]|uniref:N-acetylmuramoyl-L-alanine amidase AmiC n=1 Tax=Kushneria phyllosphaerae TaxID=2100822 RepID=A0A2R8CNX1_9GAMM|nr:N-acetylmuramoyl-L-alanine amidase [Kushneria phyllosphaerae]SPJ34503.1 N-acetylmuramoyl-L-alanine amidase AmiC [Kushneria phyllosphaerae]
MKFPAAFLTLFAMIMLSLMATAAQAAQLEGLRQWTDSDGTRLVFDLSSEAKADVFTLDNPARLVIDLTNTTLNTNLGSAVDGRGLVKDVRSGVRDGSDLRVVVELERQATPNAFKLPPGGGHGHRLVVDLAPGKGGSASKGASDGDDPITAMIQQQEQAARSKLASSRPTENPKVAEQVSNEPTVESRQKAKPHPRRDIIVVVDPGHGGKDPGASGPGGTHEKNVVLQIGRRVKAKLDAMPGFKAYLTRSDDTFIPLRGRTRIARKHHADFFVSVHADAGGSTSPRGTSVYALSQHGATSERARWLAQSENRSDLIGGVDGDLNLDDKDQVLRGVLLDLSMTATVNDSLSAGTDVLGRVSNFNKLFHSRVEQAGFVVLKSPDIPSLLVETGFLTNPSEERLLKSPAHQEKLANAIAQGIQQHFLRSPPPDSLLAWQRDQNRGGASNEYRVRAGDTLSGIAAQQNVSLAALRQVNGLDTDVLRLGQVLTIP